jgi:hypothetical protein
MVRYSLTGSVLATTKQLGIHFNWDQSGSTAVANDWIEITGVQLEVSPIMTNFSCAGANIRALELAICQRYYWRHQATAINQVFATGQATSTTVGRCFLQHPVPMRIAPTAVGNTGISGNYQLSNASGTAVPANAVPTRNYATDTGIVFDTGVASGLVAGNATQLSSATTSAYVAFDAEL